MIILKDFNYALRLLSKNPAFTALTTLVMAAGIGLSVYLFSFMHTMLFKDLPFEDGDSLLRISGTQHRVMTGYLDLHDYHEIRTQLTGASEFSAFHYVSVNVAGRDGARRYDAVAVEPNIFQLTRTNPIIGRGFNSKDHQVGAKNVTVIGYDIWQNQFGGDRQVVGNTLRVNEEPYTIVGVMPQGYGFPMSVEMWVPLKQQATQLARGDGAEVYGLAHIDDRVSREEINRQMDVIMQRIEKRYPKTNYGKGAIATTVPMAIGEGGQAVIYSLHFAAVLILMLASINVGNLLLSRALERSKETAIRVALGAPRARLMSQMMWESIIICGFGGLIGLCVLAWGLEVTQTLTNTFFVDGSPFWWVFGIDSFTLKLFAFFVVGTVIVTGVLPAWRNSASDFNSVLRDGTRGALGRKAGRLNRVLVISEIFLSMSILIIAAGFIVATYKATHADYGANTDNTLIAKVILNETTYDTPEKKSQFVKTLTARLENSFGDDGVIMLTALPGQSTMTPAMAIEHKEYTQEGSASYPRANYIATSPGSLKKLGVELRQGRYFDSSDDGLGKNTVIVSESFAARHFSNQQALGKRLRIVEFDGDESHWLTIVGVVEHTIQTTSMDATSKVPTVFRSFSQAPQANLTIALKIATDKNTAKRNLRTILHALDPALPAYRIDTYDESLAREHGPSMFISKVFLMFGIAAVALAASGIYGVMANTIQQRTQEIGVKRALGAWEEKITWDYLAMGLKPLLWGGIPGLVVGCTLAYAMAKVIGISTTDVFFIAVVFTLLIGIVVMLATYIPTRRALSMAPADALHYE